MNAAGTLDGIAAQLAAREPLFHRPELGTTRADFARLMADDFQEVTASGRTCSRTVVLDALQQRHRQPVAENWQLSDFACQQVASDLFLATYTFEQCGRVSRRASLWRQTSEGWRVVYHQGTVVRRLMTKASACAAGRSSSGRREPSRWPPTP